MLALLARTGGLGAFAGAAVFEYTASRHSEGAMRAGWGAMLGRAAASAAKMALVQPIENRAEVEVFSFMLQIELPLHRQFRVGDLSFCFLGHDAFPRFK